MPPSKGGVKFVVVIVDYFTKCGGELEAQMTITPKSITRFMWKAIICQIGNQGQVLFTRAPLSQRASQDNQQEANGILKNLADKRGA